LHAAATRRQASGARLFGIETFPRRNREAAAIPGQRRISTPRARLDSTRPIENAGGPSRPAGDEPHHIATEEKK
jgi:hypothetical protein